MPDHASRSTPEDAPYLSRFKTVDMDERWVNRSPEIMLRLLADTSVIAEGFRPLPHLVKPLLAKPGHAVWLLPTPEFRRAALDSRGREIPHKTSNPELAQRNLAQRGRMFADRLFEETKRLELPVIEIDTAMNEAELARQVTQAFGLWSREGRTGRRRGLSGTRIPLSATEWKSSGASTDAAHARES